MWQSVTPSCMFHNLCWHFSMCWSFIGLWFWSIGNLVNYSVIGTDREIEMADPTLHHETHPIKQIAIDYTPEACTHCPVSNSITLTYDHRGGARWRSTTRFLYGTFSSLIQCPQGNTSGLNFNIYLSSLEGDKSQDEIDFEFLGKDKTIVQTNYFTTGYKIFSFIFMCAF